MDSRASFVLAGVIGREGWRRRLTAAVTALLVSAGGLGVAVSTEVATAPSAGATNICGTGGTLVGTVPTSFTCTYATVGTDTFTVPAGMAQVTVDVYGAEGGRGGTVAGTPGKGGEAFATIGVVPGEMLAINVGGQGGTPSQSNPAAAGGFNGGGSGVTCNASHFNSGGGGGGASDVRQGGTLLSDRIMVGGGGGGVSANGRAGGMGGGLEGAPGVYFGIRDPGGGGTQSGGGTGTSAGTSGVGGSFLFTFTVCGGAGGGGYYGGGAGDGDSRPISQSPRTSGGGGGSGFITPSATGAGFSSGVRSGAGLVIVSSVQTPNAPCGHGSYDATMARCTYDAVRSDTFTVPPGVSSATFEVWGAQGARNTVGAAAAANCRRARRQV